MQVDLLEALERHLLKAVLQPCQAQSVEELGWFDLPWPEQLLVLRIYTDRIPTVDAYQAARACVAEAGAVGGGAESGMHGGGWVAATYLCSWDVRRVRRSRDRHVRVAALADTPTGYARRVFEAHRRGVLREFLEAGEIVNLSPHR